MSIADPEPQVPAIREQELQYELCHYTLAHGDPSFIHQHVVNAFAAQNATIDGKPIQIMFALIGLYLHLERGYSGRQVQLAHRKLATPRRTWSLPELPRHRGAIRVADVLAAAPGEERDVMIEDWCSSVWNAYEHLHSQIAEMAAFELGIW